MLILLSLGSNVFNKNQPIPVKKTLLFIFLLPVAALAQPAGYYTSANGLSGQQLKQALHNIIKNHTVKNYPLWQFFPLTDAKPNGKVWDIYSDIPGGTPPYEYTFVTQQCSNTLTYDSEADCFNHEHSWPQSYFNSAYPAQSDLFHIYPVDGLVNANHGNLPYGKVNSPSWTSLNGSKLGQISTAGAPFGDGFEPRDEYKGDIARSYFYMATRYYTEDAGWQNWDMANGAELKPWAAAMLLQWHLQDTVSAKEKARNNAIYAIQQNRNPFIDNPKYAECIWGGVNCNTTSVGAQPVALAISLAPNPATDFVSVDCTRCTISIADITGKQVYQDATFQDSRRVDVSDWPEGVYLIRSVSSGYITIGKLIVR